jgi:hypothetical protein
MNYRNIELERDYTRRLKVAAIVHERHQQEFQVALNLEKEKLQVETARYNVLYRQYQQLEIASRSRSFKKEVSASNLVHHR